MGLSDDFWEMQDAARRDNRLSGLIIAWKRAKNCAEKRTIVQHFRDIQRKIQLEQRK